MIHEFRKHIEEVDVVSFDVFDTLLLRHHYSPADVFAHLDLGGSLLPPRLRRIAAERLARLWYRHQEDVTLDQIYRFLGPEASQEIREELRASYRNPDAAELYDYAKSKGKRLIAISDMYLPETAVSALLKDAGYDDLEKVYVSSFSLATKASGKLFQQVLSDLKTPSERILHIGDNWWSDKIRPEGAGLKSIHLPSRRARFEAHALIHPEIHSALKKGRKQLHSLLLGLYRDRLSPDASYWYRLGYSVLGPIANAFSEWIHQTAKKNAAERIVFLARDGYLCHKIFEKRFPEHRTTYAYASRRLFLLPSLANSSDEEIIDGLCGALPNTTAREYLDRLGLQNEALEALLLEHFPKNERISSLGDHARLRNFFRQALPLLRPHAQGEQATLSEYLNQVKILDAKARCLVVDLGWRASSQRYLETAFPGLQGTSGAYFGLGPDAYNNGAMSAFFFEYCREPQARNVAMHCVELIELMFSAPEPSVRCLEKKADGSIGPIHEPLNAHECERIRVVEELHRAAIQFTEDLQMLAQKGYDTSLDRNDAMLFLSALILRPTSSDVAHWGAIPHALGVGTSRYETLLPPDLPKNGIRLFLDLIGPQRRRLYWPRGVTRGIGFQHGPVAGFGARCAITAYLQLLRLRELLYSAIRRK